MQITLQLQNFEIDSDNQATVVATHDGVEIMKVLFQFAEGEDCNRHQITINDGEPVELPHYVQAKVVYDASMMIDSHFNDEVEPVTEAVIEV